MLGTIAKALAFRKKLRKKKDKFKKDTRKKALGKVFGEANKDRITSLLND